jgi:hypothetical protein
MVTIVSGRDVFPIFNPEDGGNRFLLNVVKHLTDCMGSSQKTVALNIQS